MKSRVCVECARFNRFTWLEDDGTCRRASEHGMTAAERLAARDAGLGVGHIWTAVSCPAYRTLNGADCTCNEPAEPVLTDEPGKVTKLTGPNSVHSALTRGRNETR